jgi:hypothetical protein
MFLYFEHDDGHRSFITECDRENVFTPIYDFVKELNPNYKIPYVRIWGDNVKGYTFDVGSHTEFFHLLPKEK